MEVYCFIAVTQITNENEIVQVGNFLLKDSCTTHLSSRDTGKINDEEKIRRTRTHSLPG